MYRPLPESYYRSRSKEELIFWLRSRGQTVPQEEHDYDYYVRQIMDFQAYESGDDYESDEESDAGYDNQFTTSPTENKIFAQPYLGFRGRFGKFFGRNIGAPVKSQPQEQKNGYLWTSSYVRGRMSLPRLPRLPRLPSMSKDESNNDSGNTKKQRMNGTAQLLSVVIFGLLLIPAAKKSVEMFGQYPDQLSDGTFCDNPCMSDGNHLNMSLSLYPLKVMECKDGKAVCHPGYFLYHSQCASDLHIVPLMAQDIFPQQAQLHLSKRSGDHSCNYAATPDMAELELKQLIHLSLTESERNTLQEASEFWHRNIFDEAFEYWKDGILPESESIVYNRNDQKFWSKKMDVPSTCLLLRPWLMGSMQLLFVSIFMVLIVAGVCYLAFKRWGDKIKNFRSLSFTRAVK